MTDSASITVTNHRLKKAMSNLNDDDLKSHTKKLGEKIKSELTLHIGEITKIYPYRDKCTVKIKGSDDVQTCLIAHDILSEGMNVSGFPKGRVTHEKSEEVIIPSETIYGIILDVDVGGKKQKCVVSYINLDRKHTPNNASRGEYKIQVGKNVISLTDQYININSDNLFINGLPYTEAYKPLVDYHDKEEIGNIVTEIDDDINSKVNQLMTVKEDKLNKVTTLSSNSTHTQYPSAKAVYDKFQPKLINANDDLNDYTEVGMYYCPYGTVATTLTNCPVTNAFSLFVEKSSGYENACTQFITSYDGTRIKKFSRFIQTVDGTFQNSGWQPIYEDTGWQDVSLKSGFTHYDSSAHCRYRRFGKVVELRGAVKNTNAILSTDLNVSATVGNISITSCRPSSALQFVQQGSGMNRFVLQVSTNGDLTVSRYGTTSPIQCGSGSWLNLYATWLVD